MSSICNYSSLFLQGIGITLAAWLIAGTISLCIGIVLGIISSDYLGLKKVQNSIRCYTFITKGVPAYVQILIIYFALPSLLKINLSGFVAATMALALCSSGYMTEIIRSGINAIPKGQWHASFVLGYPLSVSIRRIIAPQMLRLTIPTIMGEFEQLLKSTALLATIGVTEVTRVGMNIISRELNPLPIYCTIAIIYLALSALLHMVMLYQQQRRSYGYR